MTVDDAYGTGEPLTPWALHEVVEAAREVPLEQQPERLRLALARLMPLRPPFPTAAPPEDPSRSG